MNYVNHFKTIQNIQVTVDKNHNAIPVYTTCDKISVTIHHAHTLRHIHIKLHLDIIMLFYTLNIIKGILSNYFY